MIPRTVSKVQQMVQVSLIRLMICEPGTQGLEIAERLDIAIDVAHAVAYLHMYTGVHLYSQFNLKSFLLIISVVHSMILSEPISDNRSFGVY